MNHNIKQVECLIETLELEKILKPPDDEVMVCLLVADNQRLYVRLENIFEVLEIY